MYSIPGSLLITFIYSNITDKKSFEKSLLYYAWSFSLLPLVYARIVCCLTKFALL